MSFYNLADVVEKYELELVLNELFLGEVINKSFLTGVDDNGLGLTEYGGVVNGSSGGLLNTVGFLTMADVEVIFN